MIHSQKNAQSVGVR